jgi:hypothetical protein
VVPLWDRDDVLGDACAQPLPVILALMHDADETRYYIDPKTASVVRSYSNRNSMRRWLYNGLHSLNFPWLYNHRPLWDIIVITFMVGGTGLCVTAPGARLAGGGEEVASAISGFRAAPGGDRSGGPDVVTSHRERNAGEILPVA